METLINYFMSFVNNPRAVIAAIAFIIAYVGFKKNKKKLQREASYQYILNSYIKKSFDNKLLQEAMLKKGTGDNINSTRLARWYYMKQCFKESESVIPQKERWISYALGRTAHDVDSIVVNQICFELADCLEVLGEAYISGLFQIGLAIRFVGNNFVEDWFCTYPWIYRLRNKDDGEYIDVNSQKRAYAELLAKFSFAKYLCDYCLRDKKNKNFKTYLSVGNIILTLEAFGNKKGGICQALLRNFKTTTQTTYHDTAGRKSEEISEKFLLVSSNENDIINYTDDFRVQIEKNNTKLIPFALASDLIYYLDELNISVKKNFLFITLPDDFGRMITRLSIDLRKICYEYANEKEVFYFEKRLSSSEIGNGNILKRIRRLRNPLCHYSTMLKLVIIRFFQDFKDWLF